MKEIGKYFKDQFDQFTPEIKDDLWMKIQKEPSLKKFNRNSLIQKVMFYYVTPIISVMIVGVIIWNISKNNNSNPNLPQVLLSDSLKDDSMQMSVQVEEMSIPVKEPVLVLNEKTDNNTYSSPIPSENKTVQTIQNSEIPKQAQLNPNSTTNSTSKPAAIEVPSSINQPVSSTPKPNNIPLEQDNTTDHNNDVIPESISNSSSNPDEEKQLFIPKGFTPNYDGTNDQFLIYADWEVENFEITIYHRGGNIVYKSNDIHKGWDGLFQNNELPQGVYVYIISYKNPKGDDKILKGTLNLIK